MVIAARQQRRAAVRGLAHFGAAMAADIVKSPQFAVPVAQNDDRGIEHTERHKGAGFAQFAFGCGKDPGLGKQLGIGLVSQRQDSPPPATRASPTKNAPVYPAAQAIASVPSARPRLRRGQNSPRIVLPTT